MRPYVRTLLLSVSTLALAAAFTLSVDWLTDPTPPNPSTAATVQPRPDESDEAKQQRTFKELSAKAAAGDVHAMFFLGMAYLAGLGTEIDRAAGAEWIRKSAEKGYAQAQFSYGKICRNGELRKKDDAEAVRWFRLSAAQGNADAELSLAEAYGEGAGVAKDDAESMRWLRLAATHGHPYAQHYLGVDLSDSEKPEELRECVVWLTKSAHQGHPLSMAMLGMCYLKGNGVKADETRALAWAMLAEAFGDDETKELVSTFIQDSTEEELRKARKLTRSLQANIEVSPLLGYGQEFQKANEEFHLQLEKAQAGDAEEQYRLAVLYALGHGTIKDPVEAGVWCRRAADQGDVNAMRTLAMCYEEGLGMKADILEMVKWYRRAAEKGDMQSQFRLGACYADGTGVPKDIDQAELWTKKAADQGHRIAQANMGAFIVAKGDQSRGPEALNWFRLSAKQGHPTGMYKYGVFVFNGFETKADRVEGAAWMIACLPEAGKKLKENVEECLSKLTPEERTQAEAAAVEIRKTL